MKYIGAHVSASGGVENAPVMRMRLGRRHLLCLPVISVNGNLLR